MSDLKINIRLFSGIFGAIYGAVLADSNAALIVLVIAVLIGLIFSHKKTDIIRKCLIFLLASLAGIIDIYVIKTGFVMKNTVICFYIANELIIISEKAF